MSNQTPSRPIGPERESRPPLVERESSRRSAPEGATSIGAGITIRGTISGEADLVIEGRIEGSVTLGGQLTIAASALITADIEADAIEILGRVDGDVQAATTITLHDSAEVIGNLRAPRIVIADGAQFKGAVDMEVQLPGNLQRSAPRR